MVVVLLSAVYISRVIASLVMCVSSMNVILVVSVIRVIRGIVSSVWCGYWYRC